MARSWHRARSGVEHNPGAVVLGQSQIAM